MYDAVFFSTPLTMEDKQMGKSRKKAFCPKKLILKRGSNRYINYWSAFTFLSILAVK